MKNVKWSSLRKKKTLKNMNNKMSINIYLSTITLNASGLNAPIKRYIVAKLLRKPDFYM